MSTKPARQDTSYVYIGGDGTRRDCERLAAPDGSAGARLCSEVGASERCSTAAAIVVFSVHGQVAGKGTNWQRAAPAWCVEMPSSAGNIL
jgi:hypothetical protein